MSVFLQETAEASRPSRWGREYGGKQVCPGWAALGQSNSEVGLTSILSAQQLMQSPQHHQAAAGQQWAGMGEHLEEATGGGLGKGKK